LYGKILFEYPERICLTQTSNDNWKEKEFEIGREVTGNRDNEFSDNEK
jgi:hypothetical protein